MKLIDFVRNIPYDTQIKVRGAFPSGWGDSDRPDYYNGKTQDFPQDAKYRNLKVCGSYFLGAHGDTYAIKEATGLDITVGDFDDDTVPFLPCEIGSTVYIPYVYLENDHSGMSGIEEATLVGFVDETLVGGSFWWLAATKIKDSIETHDIPRAELCVTMKQAEDRLTKMVAEFMKENKVLLVERNLGI